jgi:hypothetical protein
VASSLSGVLLAASAIGELTAGRERRWARLGVAAAVASVLAHASGVLVVWLLDFSGNTHLVLRRLPWVGLGLVALGGPLLERGRD